MDNSSLRVEGTGGSSDLIRFMLFKDHSVPSVENGLKGVGTDWRPGGWFGGGIEIQESIKKGLNKGHDSRLQEKRMDPQAKI